MMGGVLGVLDGGLAPWYVDVWGGLTAGGFLLLTGVGPTHNVNLYCDMTLYTLAAFAICFFLLLLKTFMLNVQVNIF